MMLLRPIFLLTLSFLLLSCGNSGEEFDNIEEEIQYLIDQNQYEDALDRLSGEDRDDPDIRRLYEMTYLNYGLHSMDTFDAGEMRTRMNDALRYFTEVLRINPDNEMARTQIDQILDVYETIPDRQPEEEVLDGLREVGYNI